ncbi:MAG: PEP/pyruvate-binding domain-containing protein [Candidatus Cloacimonetes bacterium]|nr:PEP/pyruvate-binding domain-containing protein [Candidatus Cloacimonadota bacterium]
MDKREITFDRDLMYKHNCFNFIGKDEPGGKAASLILMKDTVDKAFEDNKFEDIAVSIPNMTVILTDIFDIFMEENNLYEIAFSDESDDVIANKFQKASLPAIINGDLYSLISKIHKPLAVRSSSLSEDKMFEPFAGVFETKMIPNNQFDTKTRFNKLVEAIKFIYASAFFSKSKNYFRAIKKDIKDEKMAVVIQEIVGERYKDRFYPTISGVARSYNFYPMGNSKPEHGVVSLALGLGKSIVDGGKVWSFSPQFPASPPPYNNINDMLKMTQTDFWTVNMGQIRDYNPIKETEYLENHSITKAEEDKVIRNICSTYDGQSDRMNMGTFGYGPRLLNFAPILKARILPLNELLKKIMKISEEKFGNKVEIEFAMVYDPDNYHQTRFSLLQVRPMVVSNTMVEVNVEDFEEEQIMAFSNKALGNGIIEEIDEIVFVKPEDFELKNTINIAQEIAEINSEIVKRDSNYVLIGFGRWGTSDPWLGIPIVWNQISGAKIIIESALPQIRADYSQGSHFFHNLTSFEIFYFSCNNLGKNKVDWDWLSKQKCVNETKYVKHIKLGKPLQILTDGRSGNGVILKKKD